MYDPQTFHESEKEANRLREITGGIDGWLDLFPVEDEAGQIKVRVFPGSMYMFEVDVRDMGRNIIQVLRRRLDEFEAKLNQKS